MIGQTNLIKTIDTFTIDTFPKSLILEGERGSGRHLIAKYVSNKFNLPLKDITNNLTQETLENILMTPNPQLYFIDGDDIISGNKAFREENLLLKFLEEPLKNCYIILSCEDANALIGTITNRCIKWKMSPYSKEELAEFSSDEELLSIANTPGKILEYATFPIDEMRNLINKIFKDKKSTLPNFIIVSNRIAYKKVVNESTKELVWEKGKYPWMIFTDVLVDCAFKYCVDNNDEVGLNIYLLTKRLALDMKASIYADKDYLFENYFINLWKAIRGEWVENSRY